MPKMPGSLPGSSEGFGFYYLDAEDKSFHMSQSPINNSDQVRTLNSLTYFQKLFLQKNILVLISRNWKNFKKKIYFGKQLLLFQCQSTPTLSKHIAVEQKKKIIKSKKISYLIAGDFVHFGAVLLESAQLGHHACFLQRRGSQHLIITRFTWDLSQQNVAFVIKWRGPNELAWMN